MRMFDIRTTTSGYAATLLQVTKLVSNHARPFHKRPQRELAFHVVGSCAAWDNIAKRVTLVVLDPVDAHVFSRGITVRAR